jgi:hypothetical protein
VGWLIQAVMNVFGWTDEVVRGASAWGMGSGRKLLHLEVAQPSGVQFWKSFKKTLASTCFERAAATPKPPRT